MRRRLLPALLLTLALAAHLAAVFTTSVNWDEFALLARVDETHETGRFQSGGRPGLAVPILLPFVAGCRDEIASVWGARLLWVAFTLALLAGLAALVARLAQHRAAARGDAALALALLALVPAFLEWSIQVRTDQLALCGGLWGGVALLASRRRPPLALLAGALFGVGYLGSQKLFYVAGLVAALALGDALRARDLRPRRDALRLAACALGYALVVAAFRQAVLLHFDVAASAPTRELLPSPARAAALASHFEFMRQTLGWSQYRALLPSLGPHALLLLGLVAASAQALRRRSREPALWLAWVVLALGTALAFFHAAAFAYFWMTLGLFPAVAFALARERIEILLFALRPRALRVARAALWTALLLPAAATSWRLLEDTQQIQRESLAFVHRHFAPGDAGFHPEAGIFCQTGRSFETYFSQTLYQRFERPDRAARIAKLEGRFRSEPVKFLVQSFRLAQFPPELQRFFAEHYQPYRHAVYVAGSRIAGARGAEGAVELIVPGDYRWLPYPDPQQLEIDGRLVAAGAVRGLSAGTHALRFPEDVPAGLLVLALAELPGPAGQRFYEEP
jgi:hypothetical protein